MNHFSPPPVGVAIANRNKAPYLRTCLDSVLEQTHPDVHLVIVDDASTDDSAAILTEYSQRNAQVKVLFLECCQGVSAARNAAMTHLDTPWLTTLDSDDFYCHPDKLAQEVALASRSLDGSIAAFSSVRRVDKAGNSLARPARIGRVLEGDLFEAILRRSCLIPRDFVMSREAFQQSGGYDPALSIYEDWDLKLRLSRRLEFRYTGLEAIAYRQTGQGLSAADRDTHAEALRRVFERYVSFSADPVAARREFERNISPNRARRLFSKLLGKLKR